MAAFRASIRARCDTASREYSIVYARLRGVTPVDPPRETLAGLVLAIAGINVWNRLNVATRQPAGEWKP